MNCSGGSLPPDKLETLVSYLTGDAARIVVSDPAVMEQKLASLIEGGSENVAIIADFDRTITTGGSLSSHGILERAEAFDAAFRAEATANTARYLPIEQDPSLTISEKLPHMRAWYDLNHAAIMRCGVFRGMIQEAVRTSGGGLQIRDGVRELFAQAEAAGVPLLVFSAGLADVIEEVLRQRVTEGGALLGATTNVVSNRMIWGSREGNGAREMTSEETERQCQLVGFSEPLIHMFNKDQSQVPHDLQPSQRHAILLGDGLGDVTMVDGAVKPPEHVLRIGFLNYAQPEEHLAQYTSCFDIVVLGSISPMEPVNRILSAVCRHDNI